MDPLKTLFEMNGISIAVIVDAPDCQLCCGSQDDRAEAA